VGLPLTVDTPIGASQAFQLPQGFNNTHFLTTCTAANGDFSFADNGLVWFIDVYCECIHWPIKLGASEDLGGI